MLFSKPCDNFLTKPMISFKKLENLSLVYTICMQPINNSINSCIKHGKTFPDIPPT